MKDSPATAAHPTVAVRGIDALLRDVDTPVHADTPAASRQSLTAGASFAALWSESGAAEPAGTTLLEPEGLQHLRRGALVEDATAALPCPPAEAAADPGPRSAVGPPAARENASAAPPPSATSFAEPGDTPNATASVPWYTAAIRPSRRKVVGRSVQRVLRRSS